MKLIAGQKFIGFEPDIPTRKALDRILRDNNVEVQTVMEFDNIETVKRAVEIDAGISIVPQGTISQEVAKQTLAGVHLDDGDFYRPLAAIYKKNKVLSPAMKQFLAILKDKTLRLADWSSDGARRSEARRTSSSRVRRDSGITSSGRGFKPFNSFVHEQAVLADQFAVEPNLAAAPFRAAGSAPCPNAPPSGCRCRIPRRPGPGVKCSEPAIFSSNRMSHIGLRM